MTPHAPRIAVFLSGGGRTLLSLHDAIRRGDLDAEIAIVVASRECLGAERARASGLPVIVEAGDLTADRLDELAQEHGFGWVVLAGYLRLLPITERLRGRIVNIHPALLPGHAGQGMHGLRVHASVLEAGDHTSGCTVHLCDDRYDTGLILAQASCEVRQDDTPDTLASRVFELECVLYPATLQRLFAGTLDASKGLA